MTNQIGMLQLRTGQLQELADTGATTGIYKQNVKAAFLSETGLEHDEHGDTHHHGGPEKALHHFASDHYARLQKILQVSQPRQQARCLVIISSIWCINIALRTSIGTIPRR